MLFVWHNSSALALLVNTWGKSIWKPSIVHDTSLVSAQQTGFVDTVKASFQHLSTIFSSGEL
jgi:hypothetical protein